MIKENKNGFSFEEDENKLDLIMRNTKYLVKKGQNFDKEYFYMPVEVKRMLFKLWSFYGQTRFSVKEGDEYCTVEAKIYLNQDDPDEKYIGAAEITLSLSSVKNEFSLTHEERKGLLRNMTKGAAESRALKNAGIGIEIDGEEFEPIPQIDNSLNPEKDIEEETPKKDTAVEETNKEQKAVIEEEPFMQKENEKSEEETIDEEDELPFKASPKQVEQVEEDNSSTIDFSIYSIELQELLHQIIDVGLCNGKSILEVINAGKTANLLFVHKNTKNVSLKKGIELLKAEVPEIRNLFEEIVVKVEKQNQKG